MLYIPDNYDKFKAYEDEKEARLEELPVCSECDEPIQTEECYEFNDELICPDCLKDNHRKWVDDIVY